MLSTAGRAVYCLFVHSLLSLAPVSNHGARHLRRSLILVNIPLVLSNRDLCILCMDFNRRRDAMVKGVSVFKDVSDCSEGSVSSKFGPWRQMYSISKLGTQSS